MEVLLRGRIDVYAPRGDYQMIVDALEPRGIGALQVAFEQLKKKLSEEGLFESARKRKLPPYPQRIGIVTSPTGAVIRDLLQILTRRFPGLHIRLYPAQVQGEGSVEQVCRGIQHFGSGQWAEVLIVARGGGSVEDLWTFNEEAVARSIVGSRIPVVSAIGHETDFTIADFVADLRAPTPSAAAELVVNTRVQVADRLETLEKHLTQCLRYRVARARQRLHLLETARAATILHRFIGRRMQRADELETRTREIVRAALAARRRKVTVLEARLQRMDQRLRIADGKRRLQAASSRLEERLQRIMAAARRKLDPLEAHLTQLSPLRVLDRGYAIVQTPDGSVVKSAEQAPVGTRVQIRLSEGRVAAEVKAE
jgi:exodeoxyribonuclease VII large subunit